MIAFIPGSSPLHKADARVKILYLLFMLLILIVRQDLTTLGILSLATLLLYLLSGIPLVQPLRDLGGSWLFILIPVILQVLINPLTGIYLGVVNSIFLLNLICLSLLFIYTTEVRSILQALVFFKVPSEFAFMLTISIRFLPIMQDKMNRIRIAQAVRGYELAPLSLPIPLMVPLLHSSLKRAEELAISLESRGFDSENIHINMELRLNPADYLLLLFLPVVVFLSFF
jgi:energy-coupling factor transport system permease protein